jgi:quercetin dioxygenase-like cupin family protein
MSTRTHDVSDAKARCYRSMPLLLALAIPAVSAQTPVHERAVTWTAQDASIKWNPCPPFLPAGCGIAVLHGDPSKDNVDVFLKVPGKSVLPLHLHSSAERMVLVAGELHVTYDGQETAVLRAGTYAYGPAKVPHRGSCESEAPCVLFIAFESPLDAVPIESRRK